MINMYEVNETNKMIEQENLDVRTITLGISLLDCIDSDLQQVNRKVYEKNRYTYRHLVETGDEISREFGVPVVIRGFLLPLLLSSEERPASLLKIL